MLGGNELSQCCCCCLRIDWRQSRRRVTAAAAVASFSQSVAGVVTLTTYGFNGWSFTYIFSYGCHSTASPQLYCNNCVCRKHTWWKDSGSFWGDLHMPLCWIIKIEKKLNMAKHCKICDFHHIFPVLKQAALNLTMYLKKYSFLYHQINLNLDH